uniref:Probable hydrolase M10 n=1 Tax=Phoma sp. (strain ATCC 20986 / MF5453) TaxID=1828523 RepID=MFM10_PHOSM|nr:RecName: Full=Probable hydrolase M10; AltName: Full=Squalestatin S1 biosynthesis cluster protein M10; Flags: Precursor [Phoma sp. MF5453]AMY15067.1 hydrolase [Phoma sp. MF5453]
MRFTSTILLRVAVLLSLGGGSQTTSCTPGQPFPIPAYSKTSLQQTFEQIFETVSRSFDNESFHSTNVAIEVTSSQETLWSFYHAAKNQSSQDGSTVIGPDTVFRVARVSKLLTAIAILQLHDQGHISSLYDPINIYIPDLDPSTVQWGRITIWDLLNNVAGILDMYGYADIYTDFSARQRADLNLPPVPEDSLEGMPACQVDKSIPCDSAGLLSWLRSSRAVFEPHRINSNSNVGFSLLGILIERITGIDYERFISQTLIEPLHLNSTSFRPPHKNSGAVLQNDHTWNWDVGVNNPSVGLYSTPRDISTLLRWTLNESPSSLLNWFAPGFYAVGSHSLIGMPWNIFRTTAPLSIPNRPTTFNTVVGTLGPYTSVVVVMPEYDLAVSLMMNGALGHPHDILAKVTFPLVRAADKIALEKVRDNYAGTYKAEPRQKINSSITLSVSPDHGLYISELISNGSSILPVMERLASSKSGGGSNWIFQAVPTFLETKRRRTPHDRVVVNEEWRWTYVLDKPPGEGWNDWCLSSFDPVTYAGEPLTKMVFQKDAKSGRVLSVALSGYNITLPKGVQEAGIFAQLEGTSLDLHAQAGQEVLAG